MDRGGGGREERCVCVDGWRLSTYGMCNTEEDIQEDTLRLVLVLVYIYAHIHAGFFGFFVSVFE